MDKPRGSHSVRRGRIVKSLCVIFFYAGGLFGLASAGVPPARQGDTDKTPVRIISVAVAAEAGLRGNEAWQIDITRIVDEVGLALREIAGLKLKIRAYEYWTCKDKPGGGPAGWLARPRTPLVSLLPGFLSHLKTHGRAGCEIVIGLVPEGSDGPVDPGLADYLNGVVLMKVLKAKGGMSYVLLHEICHLFGAIDLRQTGSVMSLRNPAFRIDDFTRSIVRVNRDRSFRRGENPLSEGRALDAIELYRNRQILCLGEDELGICLAVLNRG